MSRCFGATRVQALVGIAAAPDFTDWGFPPQPIGDAAPQADGGSSATAAFWESGQQLLLLDHEIAIDCPVRLLHGERDEDVPLDIAFRTDARAPFIRCPAECAQGRRPSPVGAARDRRDPAHRRRPAGACPLILLHCRCRCRRSRRAAACPDVVTPGRARLPRARRRRRPATTKPPRRRSRKLPRRRSTRTRRPRGCRPRPAICGSPPTSRARPRSTSTGRCRCPVSKPSSAARPCSTAPAPPKRRTISRPRAPRLNEAAADHLRRPLLLVFLRRAGDPREATRRPPSRRSARR